MIIFEHTNMIKFSSLSSSQTGLFCVPCKLGNHKVTGSQVGWGAWWGLGLDLVLGFTSRKIKVKVDQIKCGQSQSV